MKPTLFFPALLLLSPFATAETPVNELLRDGLYAEEVSRDVEAAAKQYGQVLDRYATQRQFAATAMFRLAEVRRKQGRKDDAVALYQRLLTEFPESEAQVTLAKENLTALGAKPTPTAPMMDQEAADLARIRSLEASSPDLVMSPDTMGKAVKQGQLNVVSHLLGKGIDPNVIIHGETPLYLAAESGNLAICELLIKAGAKLNPPTQTQPLIAAVRQDLSKIADLLIKEGADVNHLPIFGSNSHVYTALVSAILAGNQPMAEKLLAAGADPNRCDPRYSISPLHFAVASRNQELLRLLIDAGADPGIQVKQHTSINGTEYTPGDTPLGLATEAGSVDSMKLLLAKAGTPALTELLARAVRNHSLAAVKMLLDAKADANSTMSGETVPLFIRVVETGGPEMTRAFLDHGADPNMGFQNNGRQVTALQVAVESGGDHSVALTEMLLAAGARPDEAWINEFTGRLGQQSAQRSQKARRLLIGKFVIPALTRRAAVTLLFTVGASGTVELAPGSKGSPAPLPQLLLEDGNPIQWPVTTFGDERYPENVSLWRKAPDGKDGAIRVWSGTLRQKEDFPALEWGDVLQASFDDKDDEEPGNISFKDKLPPTIEWNFRKRVSFPVKVEIGGKVTDYTMRGDRLTFDPTKAELPLMPARDLAWLLWPAGYSFRNQGNVDQMKVSVSRDGWPDIEIGTPKAGDRVKISLPPHDSQTELAARKREIAVRATGMPGIQSWEVPAGTSPADGITLTQVLSELLSFSPMPESEVPAKEKIVEWHFQWAAAGVRRTLWNDPDLSDIVIRRLKPDDSEEILRINLAEVIRKSDTLSAKETKKADIPLQAGDLIELKLRADTEEKIWQGLSRQEEEFFAKALGGAVQVMGEKENIFIKELSYEALTFLPTEAGKLPVRKDHHRGGFASLTVRAMFGPQNSTPQDRLTRGGKKLPETLVLRDLDQVSLSKSPRRRIAQPPPPQPRAVIPVPRQ